MKRINKKTQNSKISQQKNLAVYGSYSVMDLERSLENALSPVKPNPDFVHNLQSRLSSTPVIFLENRSAQKAYVMVAFGLFSGALIFWLFSRLKEKPSTSG